MALRCSLLGHDFGETEVDREREERGSEVVVTVTEYQRCQRCGEKTVTSENTEVTALGPDVARSPGESTSDQPPSPGTDDAAGAGLEDGESTEEVATSAGDLSDTAEVEVEAEVEAGTADETTDEDGDGDANEDDGLEIPTDENGDPITDDAEILTEPDTDDGDREHGEWPESDDVGPPVGSEAEPTAWPEEEGADGDGNDSSVESNGIETTFVEEDVGASANAGANTSETETENDATRDEPITDDAVFVDADPEPSPQQSESYTGIASAQTAPDPSKATTQGGANTEFFCPQCSFIAPGDRGSLRAGDICPECRKGYLGERKR
ncbi:DUF7093 family protein [Natronosalvus rutilus]|uniref:Uncharacterized protein n=1 Tax=Natronosalvus rutilus TaxID=2953753 RepID=A0A9E7N9E6_9EURY|nr:hypothetical protein [Natronosalvus rutilus]UTF53880.1 hypothetical protein NGM29_00935 [Natronosalvus rutilus]